MSQRELERTARRLIARGKGILAIDESFPTIRKRFDAIEIESTERSRRDWRELLITAPDCGEYISGMILFDETLRQQTQDENPFPRVLEERGVLPGIKVDKGAKPLAGHGGEKVTEGLDGLRERLQEYRELGARFAKWRAVITVGDGIPSDGCIEANVHALARYAALCQEEGLVPIVEPEVLMDGAHDVDRCYEATEHTLRALATQMYRQRVVSEHVLLKTNMVLAGKECARQAGVEEVAERTVRCLKNAVPAAVAGVVFLSGGQSAVQATRHLNAMNARGDSLPWPLSFSYGRALQDPCLKIWQGRAENAEAAQRALLHRAKCNGLACLGQYTEALEEAA